MCFISQGYAVCCRWFLLALLVASIVLSMLTVSSCHFLEYIDSTSGKAGAFGLYRFYNPTTFECEVYSEEVTSLLNEGTRAARFGGVGSVLAALIGGLFIIVEFCCCRFCCSRLLEGISLLSAMILQGITFLLFDSQQFCNGDLMNEILHQVPCSAGEGSIFSAMALVGYFLSGVLLFCTPKPEPMRQQKHVSSSSSSSRHASMMSSHNNITSMRNDNDIGNDIEQTPVKKSSSATWT